MSVTLYTDGGARGNPGHAAIGCVIKVGDKEYTHSAYIGETTNNVAEYKALLEGIRYVVEHAPQEKNITIYMDSELIVKQFNGEYKIKNKNLKPYLDNIRALITDKALSVDIHHIKREDNEEADRLVNEELDARI